MSNFSIRNNLNQGGGLIVPIGTILSYMGDSEPANYLWCRGQTFDKTIYPELYKVLGTNILPDLSGKFLLGSNSNHTKGSTGGSEDAVVVSHTHTFNATTGSNGSHSHTFTGNNATGGFFAYGWENGGTWGTFSSRTSNSKQIGGNDNNKNFIQYNFSYTPSGSVSDNGSHSHSVSGTTDSYGNNGAGKNMPPYYTINYIIRAK